MESFDRIYLNVSKQSGRCKVTDRGLGWKPSGEGETFTLDKDDIASAHWSRAAKGHEIRIYQRSKNTVIRLDGFDKDDFDRAAKAFKLFYGVTLEAKEHALRGYNWGKGDFGKSEMTFNVLNRPAFEIPYTEISNANQSGKNEVAIEFKTSDEKKETNGTNGVNGKNESGKSKQDELVEMRFYVPPAAKATKAGKNADVDEQEEDEAEVQDAGDPTTLFYESIMSLAEIGEVAGDTFATFLDVLHLTPRGRFDIDMYENSFRLRGKTYDYKIQYDHIKKFVLLPKPDDLHTLIVIGLEPPLRQGQTRYPFLVMQFKREEEVVIELNITDEMLENQYKGRLEPRYEEPQHSVVAKIFRGLTGKRVATPSKDFSSHHSQSGVKCSIKANEGHLYCLDKAFIFVPKPSTYIAYDQISVIVLSRVGGAVSASRTFDITITTKGSGPEHQFSNINREEQKPLEEFFAAKGLRMRNEMLENDSALIQAALKDADLSSDDDGDADMGDASGGGAAAAAAKAMRGSADEDSESEDEDFQDESESDVAEEFDSNAADSSGDEEDDDEEGGGGGRGGKGGADSDVDMDDVDDGGSSDGGKKKSSKGAGLEPKKKKVKTTK